MSNNTYTIQRFRKGYAAVWIDAEGKRRRYQLAASTEPEAEAEARQRWSLAQGSDWSVDELIEGYIKDRWEAGKVSAKRMEEAWSAMQNFWSGISPALIDEQMMKRYVRTRRVSPATVRYELQMLGTAIRWGNTNGYTDTLLKTWLPPQPERKRRHLTREEFATFFEGLRAPHAKLFVRLAIATCARPGALFDLTWDRVNFRNGFIDLYPEGHVGTNKRRAIVPIADYVMPYLVEAHQARLSEFVIEKGGKRVKTLKKAMEGASERSGIKVTQYMLRHTAAVWRAEDGVPMSELAQLMGHNDSRTTEKHYARYSPDHLRGAANAGGWEVKKDAVEPKKGSSEPTAPVETGHPHHEKAIF